MTAPPALSRRGFLQASAAAASGLWLSMQLPGCATTPMRALPPGTFRPNAWLTLEPSGRIVLYVARVEMGQGTWTSSAQLLAEELEVRPEAIHVEHAFVHEDFANSDLGFQVTGGSTSTKTNWTVLRKAGATARETLRRAAAETWGVPVAEVSAEDGHLLHAASGKRVAYGEMAEAASRLAPPEDVPLKPASSWKHIGAPTPRVDLAPKVDGSAVFGMDVRVPGLRYAKVVRCLVFGGKVKSFDAKAALAMKGVVAVVEIDSGVAAVAGDTWTARKAAEAVKIEWDLGPNAALSSASLAETYRKLAAEEGSEVRAEGDVEKAWASAAKKLEAIYEVPYLSHAGIEPTSCTALIESGKVTVWAPTQIPDMARTLAAQVAGVSLEDVEVHTTLIGGGFGRRLPQDYVVEAVGIAKQVPGPVKVVWSREDDLAHDFYRPAAYNVLRGAVDDGGAPLAWSHRVVSQSISTQVAPSWLREMLPDWTPGILAALAGGSIATAYQHAWMTDEVAVEGAHEVPYALPHYFVDLHIAEPLIPVGFWRSVGHSENGFVVESFIDELAHLAEKDPYAYRRGLLSPTSRSRRVLEAVATASSWEAGPPPGRFRGIAQHKSFGSYAAHVVEVSVDAAAHPSERLRVHKVWCAIDAGRVVNPDIVRAQMEGGTLFGLSMALGEAITLEGGRVMQQGFHDYPLLRMHQAPDVEVTLVASEEEPTGVGEPGVPSVAPALTNAIYAATKKRLRRLPIRGQLEELA